MNTLNQHLLTRLRQIRNKPSRAYVSGFPGVDVKFRPETLVGFHDGDELLDIAAVAKRLGIPKGTVYELTRHRSRIHGDPLPHFKVGRRLKFNWSKVVGWLDELEKAGAR